MAWYCRNLVNIFLSLFFLTMRGEENMLMVGKQGKGFDSRLVLSQGQRHHGLNPGLEGRTSRERDILYSEGVFPRFFKNCTVYTKQRVSRQGTDTKTTFGLVWFSQFLIFIQVFSHIFKASRIFYTQRDLLTQSLIHTHTHTRQREIKFTFILLYQLSPSHMKNRQTDRQ